MMNPDGVFLGNYRSNAMGSDLNRSWHISNPWCHPTIKAVLALITSLDKSQVIIVSYNTHQTYANAYLSRIINVFQDLQIDFILDIHASTNLNGCFIYGNTYNDVYR